MYNDHGSNSIYPEYLAWQLRESSDANPEYLVQRFFYTTAEIEEMVFWGEVSDPRRSVSSELSAEVNPVIFTVIDGEARVVKDESPPGAKLADPASGLFRLAGIV